MKESIQMSHIKDSNFKYSNLDDLYEFYDLYQGFVPIFNNCDCKRKKQEEEEKKKKKKKKKKKRVKGHFLEHTVTNYESFKIYYNEKISTTAKFWLSSFAGKYLYQAMDDIFYSSNLTSIEQNNLLEILFSPVISLHNNLSINFFNIWITEIYLNEVIKINKFLTDDSQNLNKYNYITIQLEFTTGRPIQKLDPLW